MEEKIEVLNHSCVKISGEEIVYVDPYGIMNEYSNADYIFITHSHYDHFSSADINRIKKNSTVIVVTEDLKKDVISLGFSEENIKIVKPNEEYQIGGIQFSTINAYNKNKNFHPKENGWVGYVIKLGNTSYYVSGDTDFVPEMAKIKCDVAFVPVGGTYTMDAKEAAKFINKTKPKMAVPIHYGSVVGNINDAEKFVKMIRGVEGKILL